MGEHVSNNSNYCKLVALQCANLDRAHMVAEFLTNDLHVRSIFAGSNIDEVEVGVALSKASRKVFKDRRVLNDACPSQSIRESANVCVDAHNDLVINW